MRLELFFHHYFKSRGVEVDLHPDLDGSDKHPDFLIHHPVRPFYLEATIRQEEADYLEQENFTDDLNSMLSVTFTQHQVSMSSHGSYPTRAYLSQIKDYLQEQLRQFDISSLSEKEVFWRNPKHKNSGLVFCLSRGDVTPRPLELSPVIGGWSGIGGLLYHSVNGKARKYGNWDLPYVVSVWALASPDTISETSALYGAEAFVFKTDQHGNALKNSAKVTRQPDGVFSQIGEDGQVKNRNVSAVVFYQHYLGDHDIQHRLRVYHNPFALNSLPQKIFSDEPKFVPVESGDKVEMRWINGPTSGV